MKRVTVIVLDSLGIGALPDAKRYGDAGTHTLDHIAQRMEEECGGLHIPHLQALGLGNIEGVLRVAPAGRPEGSFARLSEASKGKDTITGHWEIAGLQTQTPFQTFARFPDAFIAEYERRIGVKTLGNYAASGTEIIKELGEEHKRTKQPIVYTSADSVFQIAANVEVVPLATLYRYCEIAREMLVGDLQVGRVIARPFTEKDGVYTRTADRRDYAVSPPAVTMLDLVKQEGQTVFAVGKIQDIFNDQGVTESLHNKNNMDGVDHTLHALSEEFAGLIFTNLVDFDSLYGHRRDPIGYGKAIEEFDARLPQIFSAMQPEDILMICADHGNDPIHSGWDHTREYVPLLICGEPVAAGIDLKTRASFSDIAATVCDYLGVGKPPAGESFLAQILKRP